MWLIQIVYPNGMENHGDLVGCTLWNQDFNWNANVRKYRPILFQIVEISLLSVCRLVYPTAYSLQPTAYSPDLHRYFVSLNLQPRSASGFRFTQPTACTFPDAVG